LLVKKASHGLMMPPCRPVPKSRVTQLKQPWTDADGRHEQYVAFNVTWTRGGGGYRIFSSLITDYLYRACLYPNAFMALLYALYA